MADKKPYGDVAYADPGYQSDGKKRYPIDTEAHCKAAWSYINQDSNASMYTADQLSQIKGRIKSAAKKFGITIDESNALELEGAESQKPHAGDELVASRERVNVAIAAAQRLGRDLNEQRERLIAANPPNMHAYITDAIHRAMNPNRRRNLSLDEALAIQGSAQ